MKSDGLAKMVTHQAETNLKTGARKSRLGHYRMHQKPYDDPTGWLIIFCKKNPRSLSQSLLLEDMGLVSAKGNGRGNLQTS